MSSFLLQCRLAALNTSSHALKVCAYQQVLDVFFTLNSTQARLLCPQPEYAITVVVCILNN